MIQSLLTTTSSISTDSEIAAWIKQRNSEVEVKIDCQPLAQLAGWHFDDNMFLRHNSGKFFSIEGIHVETDYGKENTWELLRHIHQKCTFIRIILKYQR